MSETTTIECEKTLSIILDKGFKHTRYTTLNYSIGCDSIFFEGTEISGKKVSPLKEAKIWAKSNNFTILEVVSLSLSKKDRIYRL